MTFPGRTSAAEGESLGSLFSRLIEDGKRFVRAEIALYKQRAIARVTGYRTAAILLVAALLVVQASLTTLLVGVGLGIARLIAAIGTAGGVIIAALVGLAVAGLLARSAIARISAAMRAGDEPESPAR